MERNNQTAAHGHWKLSVLHLNLIALSRMTLIAQDHMPPVEAEVSAN
ncbi:hypothetical protein SAMN05216215_110510 [Saccharopolyspora shandongensis]|uniref:Uncharacterized protein n=1 Tax=Saccharopolyspora shandongensis TaxID=418495 RepID=A0A1H3U3L4_9PSEU|nr:hypothetical protein SAMN05216215_110510 [Saccharopolyspora shandongensis]